MLKKDKQEMPNISSASTNQKEIANFVRMAKEWWNPNGKFRPLHKFNPVRLEYILQQIYQTFGRNKSDVAPLRGLKILDVGCGGGLLCEPLARLGAEVVGIDVAYKNIEIAKLHAQESGLKIEYRAQSLEDLVEQAEEFDVVLNMEVVEHVDNPEQFIATSLRAVRPNGVIFIATLNRNFKSWALAIIAAEYFLGWLPKGTHNIKKFIKPEELKKYFLGYDFNFIGETGVVYKPLKDKWQLSSDMGINYMIVAQKQPKLST